MTPRRRAVAAPVRYFEPGCQGATSRRGRIHGRNALAYSPKVYPRFFSRLDEWRCGFVKPLMLL